MLFKTISAIKDGLAVYQKTTPLTQKLSRAAALCAGGLATMIIPDVLTAFGVTIASGKVWCFSIYGGFLYGLGAGQLLFPMFFRAVPKAQEGEKQEPNPQEKTEQGKCEHHGPDGDSL